MKPDEEGFMYPVIEDEGKCINCKSCLNVCPLKHQKVKAKSIINSFGGYSQNEKQIKECASGGFATVLSTQFISSGGIVYGVEYNLDDVKDVRFTRCSEVEQLEGLKGSKYVQSRKYDTYKSINKNLKDGCKVLFIGLPCEVAGLYNYLAQDYDSLYTCSLICHGPTSLKVHTEFINNLLNKTNHTRIKYFSVRNKQKAWKPYFIKAVFDDGTEYVEKFMSSNYGIAFRQLKRPSCSTCRFKINDKTFGVKADLVVGDFHLAHKGMTQYNYWGSSQISIFSQKGKFLCDLASDKFKLSEISNYQAIHHNAAFYKIIPTRWNRSAYSLMFQKKGLEAACKLKSVGWIDSYVSNKKKIRSVLAKFLRMIKK